MFLKKIGSDQKRVLKYFNIDFSVNLKRAQNKIAHVSIDHT